MRKLPLNRTNARSGTWGRPALVSRRPTLEQSYRARQALYKDCPLSKNQLLQITRSTSIGTRFRRPATAVPRGESREGSGRDGIVPLMLQRDYTVSMPTI